MVHRSRSHKVVKRTRNRERCGPPQSRGTRAKARAGFGPRVSSIGTHGAQHGPRSIQTHDGRDRRGSRGATEAPPLFVGGHVNPRRVPHKTGQTKRVSDGGGGERGDGRVFGDNQGRSGRGWDVIETRGRDARRGIGSARAGARNARRNPPPRSRRVSEARASWGRTPDVGCGSPPARSPTRR